MFHLLPDSSFNSMQINGYYSESAADPAKP